MEGARGKETYEEIVKWIETFVAEAGKFYTQGNKSAGKRARQALDRVSKLKVQWRKETV